MRVLALLTDAYGGYGGIAVYNRDVLQALCDNPDVDLVLAIPRLMPYESGAYPDKLIYVTDGLGGVSAYVRAVMRAVFTQGPFDFVLCGHINLAPLAWLAAKFLHCPIVMEIYGLDAWQPTGKVLADRLSSKADLVISISQYTKDRFLGWSGVPEEKVVLLPNAISLERYGVGEKSREMVQRYKLEKKKVLLAFGRLVSYERAKGFDEVLDVLPELLEEEPDIKYVISGEGEYRATLEKKVRRLGLTQQVVFTGMVAEEEKADLYRLADVYVMPSRGEGFGFVFLEAMACGIPVVASKVDGSRDAVMGGKLGEMVDPDDPKELKRAILRSLKKKKQVPEGLLYFSFDKFSSRLNYFLKDIINKKHA